MSEAFLEEMGFVAAGVRKLTGPSQGWRKTVFLRCHLGGLGEAGRVAQASAGQGTQVYRCLCESLPLILGVLERLCGSAPFSCSGFRQLKLRYVEALCSLGNPALSALCRRGCGV